MVLKVYNTLSKEKEEFKPLDPKRVKMYVCGITPYDETHVGHARAYVTFDVIRRYLEESGYKVLYVQNITDIDDKIIKKSSELGPPAGEAGVRSNELTDKYTKSYFEVMDQLNVKRAGKYPKATEHIKEMVKWIKGLVDKGFAYEVQGDVYFEVEKFADYGKFSERKKKDMQAGVRVAVDERKKNPLDFALWKAAKEGEPSWDSPWGKGRPGWHIECSVMSTKYLGEQFDIHGGGRDLIFPHHENEIAQTEAATGKVPWVKYWIHNGFVNVNKQKMSKSLGNFFTLRDVFKKFDSMVVRFFLLQTHYRSPIDFSDEQLTEASEALSRIENAVRDYDFLINSKQAKKKQVKIDQEIKVFKEAFLKAMDDDFNTAGAIAVIFEMVRFMNKQIKAMEFDKKLKAQLLELCGILGLKIGQRPKAKGQRPEVDKLIAEREEARKNKDFKKADEIRDKLKEMGVELEDTPYGTRWNKNA